MWDRGHPHDRREGLFGGRGAVLVWNLSARDPRPPFGAFLACELEGGASVGPHVQQALAEVVIVLEGEGVARVGSVQVSLRPGVIVEVPLGETLALENASVERPLRYLIVKAGSSTVENADRRPAPIRQITVQELKALMDSGAPLELWDVRTEAERALARLDGARLLDDEGVEHIEQLGRDTPLVFHCHHGIRSQAAAQHFLAKGFTNLSNVIGGIEAWSVLVDPSVPRY